jgi:hypothetical protein
VEAMVLQVSLVVLVLQEHRVNLDLTVVQVFLDHQVVMEVLD